MTTNELKSYVDRILGNNVRVLLPSYWWKRAFGAVIDKVEEKVEKAELKTVNGESILGEGDLKIGVKSVESVEELNALDAEVGDMATVGSESLNLVSAADLRQITNTDEVLEEWDSFTRIGKIEFGEPYSETNRHASLWLSGKREYPYDVIVVSCEDGEFNCIHSSSPGGITLDSVNKKLKERDYRLILSSDADVIDRTYKLYAYSASADAYIKSNTWDKLAKEYIVPSEEELNRLDVPNGTIAKVASGGLKAGSFRDCYHWTEDDWETVAGVTQLKEEAFSKCTKVSKVEVSVPTITWDKDTYVVFSNKERSSIVAIILSTDDGKRILWEKADTHNGTMEANGILWSEGDSLINQTDLDRLNTILANENCFYVIEDIPDYDIVDACVRPMFLAPVVSDAYIKADTWKRLLKEGDVTGGSGDDKTLTFYAPTDGSSLSDTEKQHNAESYQKVAEGFESDKYYDIKVLLSTSQLVALDVIKTINPASDNGRLKLIFGGVGSGIDLQMLTVTSDGSATIENVEESNFDSELSDTSENAVQNKVVKSALDGIAPVYFLNGANEVKPFIDALLSKDSETNKHPRAVFATSIQGSLCYFYADTYRFYEENGKGIFSVEYNLYDKRYRRDYDSNTGEFIKEEEIANEEVITAALNNKVDKVNGKQLSTEDFTTALKTKLEGLSNYDDTSIQNAVNSLTTQINTLVSGDASVAIESFNEIIAFLNGVEDSESLDSIIASIEQQIAAKQDKLVSGTNIKTINGESILGEGNIVVNVDTSNLATKEELNAKQDKISDLETIRSGAAKGATALQEHQDISHLASKEELQNLQNEVIANEEVVAAAINDLNTRLAALEAAIANL